MNSLRLPSDQDLDRCLIRDRPSLRSRLRGLRKRASAAQPFDQGLAKLWLDIQQSQALLERRKAQVPRIQYPEELPVSERRAEVAELIARHQVVVLCGETGSGKSTQLPKICLELGRGLAGRIGHTQPRRIAARTLASRIAQELGASATDRGGDPINSLVGYKVRFHDRIRPETCIKLMTDGILLAEIQQDRLLTEYDTLIIDEAHERSLNIDFLLGYLRGILPRRPDLKLIVTSATIDPQRFASHFAEPDGQPAPIVEISGRTWPVEVRYRPPADDEHAGERDDAMQQAISDAVCELAMVGRGDVLVFLSGEREIRETAETLRKHHPPATEILPLFARQGPREQARIFQPHSARRVILTTNVAETSLTVPGIHYVIDPGFARISRYSHRTKVQRLPVERISQASANQRKGRCGRIASGVCIRLYREDNFESRADFTEPEIARTNLAAVILQMKMLGFGAVERFPFVDPPDSRLVTDGYRALEELGALDTKGDLTTLGKQLGRLPVDPRIGRMLLAAVDHHCLGEMLIIAAALSVQDPRERPLDKQQAADEIHATFRHPESDFLTFVNLWRFLDKERHELSRNKFIKLCQRHFLSWNRVQEWRDIHAQLREQMLEIGKGAEKGQGARDKGQGRTRGEGQEVRSKKQGTNQHEASASSLAPCPLPLDPVAIHRALLTGLLGNIGFREAEREFQGARNGRFFIHPSSALFAKPPKWVVVAERVETTRQYGRIAAQVQPGWIEDAGRHLLQRSYSEPHWQAKSGQVAAFEKVTLFGVTLVPKRRVNYGPINPAEAREIFLRFALTEGDFETRAPFWRHNRELIEYVRHLEAKSRRRDILVDEEAIYTFYADRVPTGIYSTPQFEKWLRQATRAEPKLLHMRMSDLMLHEAADVTEQSFPDSLRVGATALPLEYRFEPGDTADGVTLVVPLPLINQVSSERLDWLVPGLIEERIVALLRGLPKQLRKTFVPIPDTAARLVARLKPSDRPLVQALSEALKAMTGIQVPEDAWDPSVIPEHLRMKIRLVDDTGKPLAVGDDPIQLKRQFGGQGRQGFSQQSSSPLEREDITRWTFGDLPEQVDLTRAGIRLRGYPALVDCGDRVAIRILDSAESAAAAQRAGLRRLVMLHLGADLRQVRRQLTDLDRMRLQYARAPNAKNRDGSPALGPGSPTKGQPNKEPDLADELIALILDLTFLEGLPPIRTQAVFEQRLAERKDRLFPTVTEVCKLIGGILAAYQDLRQRLASITQVNWMPSVLDIQAQLDALIFRGFPQRVPFAHLKDYPRYLKAIDQRLGRLTYAPDRDRQWMADMDEIQSSWRKRVAERQRTLSDADADPRLDEIRWLLEELRVALFAQQLGTAVPVSVKRIRTRWRELGL
ncbi:ATP-dependent RNA helicase HrpA [Thiocystis violascens]|uniref:ATP-dependent helicase HrpA n=1 Tax=Thiocystis violascens (strain ATCC 17096 / DSM 198 / 6111) TaxID=765911 RepID=I3YE03_THIV6|nr:ATP-dependent RNA helicase HrpA [Thiocystis violascens]AFL75221.1 ATP-dependent helicase HrpA [Thiocystis violascens DSM 198]